MGTRGNAPESGVRLTVSIVTDTLCFLSFFALQDWTQDSGHHLEGSHLIYPFHIVRFTSSISFFFFLALGSISFMEGKSECSCTYGSRFSRNTHKETDQQIIFTNLSENCQHEREAQATFVLIFIGQCCCEFLRCLHFFTVIYKEVLTCSLRGT